MRSPKVFYHSSSILYVTESQSYYLPLALTPDTRNNRTLAKSFNIWQFPAVVRIRKTMAEEYLS